MEVVAALLGPFVGRGKSYHIVKYYFFAPFYMEGGKAGVGSASSSLFYIF